MALTVRATQEDEKVIDKAKDILGIKSGSQALLESAKLLPVHKDEIKNLKEKLNKTQNALYDIVNAQKAKKEATIKLEELCEAVEIPYSFTYNKY